MRSNIVSERTRGNTPLPESQCLKTLKVAFHHATKDEVVTQNVRLDKQSTVQDLLNEIKSKVELSHPNAELRLLEVFYHKIYKIFPLNEKIEHINDQYWTLRAEEVPEEEKNLGPHDRLIHVYHFTKNTVQNPMHIQNFGHPFFLVLHEAETLAEVKLRIQKKLQVPDEEFSKWKLAFVLLGRPEYLQDNDIVASCFMRHLVYGSWEKYLGLEHSDTGCKRAYAANQGNKVVKKFHEKSVNSLLEEEREQLYGDYATGDKVYIPTMEPQFVNIEEDGDGDQEENHWEDRSGEDIDSQASKQAQKSQSKVNPVQMKNNRRRSAGSIMLSTQISELVSCCKKLIGDRSSTMGTQQLQPSSISIAMKKFNHMVENGAIGKGSDIWFYTLSMFEDATKREIFSNMQDDYSRLIWLNRLYKEKEDD